MYSTTPYQQPPYEAASQYRGYRLPTQAIFQGLDAQNQFWEEGAQLIRNKYNQGLNLNLTLNSNKAFRDSFMKNAEKEIEQLSSLNLADNSVKKKGLNVLKPLFENENILYDDTITKKRAEVISQAEKFKNDPKTKGAGYNVNNLIFSLDKFKGFNENTNEKDLKKIYENAKDASYIPYHDVTKTMEAAYKECPEQSVKTTTPINGGFQTQTTEENKLSVQAIFNCIYSRLGSKDFQQLYIDGYVSLSDNMKELGRIVSEDIASESSGNRTQVNELLLKLKDEKLTSEERILINTKIRNIKNQMEENKVLLNKINNGDYSDLEKDKESWISKVWPRARVRDFASSREKLKYVSSVEYSSAGLAYNKYVNMELPKFQKEMEWYDINQLSEAVKAMGTGDGKNSSILKSKLEKMLGDKFGLYPETPVTFPGSFQVQEGEVEINVVRDNLAELSTIANENLTTLKNMANSNGLILESDPNDPSQQAKYIEELETLVDAQITLLKPGQEMPAHLRQMRNVLDAYNTTTLEINNKMEELTNVEDFINKSDNPEVRKSYDAIQKIGKKFESELGDKYAILRLDPTLNNMITLTGYDLSKIARGSHPTYRLDKDGNISTKDGTKLQQPRGTFYTEQKISELLTNNGYKNAETKTGFGSLIMQDIGFGSIEDTLKAANAGIKEINKAHTKKIITNMRISSQDVPELDSYVKTLRQTLGLDEKYNTSSSVVEKKGNKYFVKVEVNDKDGESKNLIDLLPSDKLSTAAGIRVFGNETWLEVPSSLSSGLTFGGTYSTFIQNQAKKLELGQTINTPILKTDKNGKKYFVQITKLPGGNIDYNLKLAIDKYDLNNSMSIKPNSNPDAIQTVLQKL